MSKNELFQTLEGLCITSEDLNKEVEYLIESFLVKNTLNQYFAQAGKGKSWFVLSLGLHLLEMQKISKLVYLDMDNSITALKDRKIDKLTAKYENLLYIHISKLKTSPMQLLKDLSNMAVNNIEEVANSLIIVDSIRDFSEGKDMNTDKDVIPIMSCLKTLRDKGEATVIFLHHTKKSNSKVFKGSSSFNDGVDVSFSLDSERKVNKLKYIMNQYKSRISVSDCSFELNTETMELVSEDVSLSHMSEQEATFVKQLDSHLFFLDKEGMKQSDIIKEFSYIASDKTIRDYLKKHDGIYWKSQRKKKNNSIFFYYIDVELPKLLKPPKPDLEW